VTHIQAVAGHPCNGHLRHFDDFPFREVSPRGIVDLVVVRYQCERCGQWAIREHVFDPDALTVQLRPAFVFGAGASCDTPTAGSVGRSD
jgi:hypothetical protein